MKKRDLQAVMSDALQYRTPACSWRQIATSGLTVALSLSLAACVEKGEEGESQSESDQTTASSPQDENFDPQMAALVSSDGETIEATFESTANENFIEPYEGVGKPESVTFAETEQEYEALLALPVLTADGPIAPGEIATPKVIIGTDDRRKVTNTTAYPSRAQVMVVSNRGRCSGTMLGKDVVITAGHCVHGGRGGQWRTNVRVFPGRNGRAIPFGSCTARKLLSLKGWTQNGDSRFDFGAIKLNCTVGNRTGWLGFMGTNGGINGKQAIISGYPGDKPFEQWIDASKNVKSSNRFKAFYDTDTVGGNSGSGVYSNRNVPANCAPCVHTAHTNGNRRGNSGAKIDIARFNHLKALIAE